MIGPVGVRAVGWFLVEFLCLFVPCVALYRLGDLVLGQDRRDGVWIAGAVSLYFTIAMRVKGVSR